MSRTRFLLAAVVVTFACAAVGVLGAGVSVAQTYGSGMTVSDAHPSPGTDVTVDVTGMKPNTTAQVTFDSVPLATTTTDSNGAASTTVAIPSNASAGEHTLTVAHIGPGARSEFSKSVTVVTGGNAFLHDDGRSTGAIALTLLIVVGAVVAVFARHRAARSTKSSA
jgi:hypothetical protein